MSAQRMANREDRAKAKATREFQARIIAQYETMRKLVEAVVEGFSPDPGTSDLDDEQRIVVRMNLGLYRDAQALQWDFNKTVKP